VADSGSPGKEAATWWTWFEAASTEFCDDAPKFLECSSICRNANVGALRPVLIENVTVHEIQEVLTSEDSGALKPQLAKIPGQIRTLSSREWRRNFPHLLFNDTAPEWEATNLHNMSV